MDHQEKYTENQPKSDKSSSDNSILHLLPISEDGVHIWREYIRLFDPFQRYFNHNGVHAANSALHLPIAIGCWIKWTFSPERLILSDIRYRILETILSCDERYVLL